MLISELHVNKKNYLYEGLNTKNLRSVMLWESAGRKLIEAQLTPNQVLQIFQQAEQGATAAGSNRTLVGKGKDAASAVNQAWEDLKTKVQTSGPIKNVDAMYDQAAEKLKQATGGDQGVMQYVEKYRAFAKKHPVAQSLIYSALIAAAGISGAGLGGAAALGLFKMTDKLLQGEKFSSAAYSGAKTGAAAYAAGQVGKAMQGDHAGQAATQAAAGGPQRLDLNFWKTSAFGDRLTQGLNNPNISQAYKDELVKQLSQSVANPNNTASVADAWRMATKAAQLKAGNPYNESINVVGKSLSEGQISKIFALAIAAQLNEGIMDTIKGVASKAGQWAQTKGHNLTTKITADKLAQAWEKAGSPMDSDEIAAVLKAQGVTDDTIASVYSQMKLPVPASAPAATTTATATTTANTAATTAPAGKIDSMIAAISNYIEQGGSITPKQRGAFASLWKQMGGTQIAENKRKKKNSP